jgi:hypothetical protein
MSLLRSCSGFWAWGYKDFAPTELVFDSLEPPSPGSRLMVQLVFEAKDQAVASSFMNGDPAVLAGVMTAEPHPFSVILARKNPE